MLSSVSLTPLATTSSDVPSAGLVLVIIALLVLFAAGGALSNSLSVLRLAVVGVLALLAKALAFFVGAILLLILLGPIIFAR